MAGESQIEVVLGAIMERLEDDADLATLAPGGVHLVEAPAGTQRPYVIVKWIPGGSIVSTLAQARAMRTINLEILGVTSGAGSIDALRIDEHLDTLLTDYRPEVAAPWSIAGCRRVVDIPRPVIEPGGVELEGVGGLYRVRMSGSAS